MRGSRCLGGKTGNSPKVSRDLLSAKPGRAYSCQWCGHHLHPTVGTPFALTRTPLQLWFYAIFLFTTTRNGVAAKELERQLGVTYKTAWRMAGLIREHMASVDDRTDNRVGGHFHTVEIDETLVGGEVEGKGKGYKGNKTYVVGMVERGGDVVTHVPGRVNRETLHGLIIRHVRPGSTINTDEFLAYKGIDKYGYRHVTVEHGAREYARPDGAGVNSIEGFWSQLKRMINGTHIHVSGKHLWRYAKEAEYRFNRRHNPAGMLDELLTVFRP